MNQVQIATIPIWVFFFSTKSKKSSHHQNCHNSSSNWSLMQKKTKKHLGPTFNNYNWITLYENTMGSTKWKKLGIRIYKKPNYFYFVAAWSDFNYQKNSASIFLKHFLGLLVSLCIQTCTIRSSPIFLYINHSLVPMYITFRLQYLWH